MNQDEILRNMLLEREELKKENKELREENKTLKEEIKKLKEKANKDSRNSSKPPSTDNRFKDKVSSKAKNSNKKRGGQKGNKGNNLKKSDNPDKIEVLENDVCINCKHNLVDVEVKSISSKQVFDIPKVEMQVTEFQQHNKICPCCKTMNKPDFPVELNSYVQYGDNIKTFVAYLNTYQMVPYERIGELVEDFTSHKMSSGTIYNILEKFGILHSAQIK
jgi:transposase